MKRLIYFGLFRRNPAVAIPLVLKLLPWAGVVVIVLVVVYIEFLRQSRIQPPIPFLLLFAAVVLTAGTGGLRPGITSAAVTATFMAYSTLISFGPPTLTGGPLQIALGIILVFITAILLGRTKDQNKALIQELNALNETLEQRVAERTAELEKLTAELTDSNAELERAEAERARYTAQLKGLAKASLVINSALSLDPVLQIITEQARKVIGAHQSVTSFTVNENWAQAISAISLSDTYAAWREYDEKPDGSGIYRLVCQMNRPMRMTQAELEAHPAWRGFGKEAGKHPPMRGWLAAPLTGHNGQNTGLIQLSDKYEGEFTEGDEAILVQLAQMASVAVENAQLYVELEQRVTERTAELRETNAELEAFAYSVSHDLRAPLRAQQGLSQALLEDYADRLDPAGQDYAQRIIAAARHMDVLIQDLLAYSRLSRAKLQPETVSLDQVVEEALTQLEAEIQGKGAHVTVEESLPQVVGHHATLLQVMANLLTNAVKFVGPGVKPQVRIWAEEREEWVRLWVEDNGIGIAPEHQKRIFYILERLHGVETYPGTGIGLAIVCKGVERLGGRVGVESASSQGSKFWVELPKAENKP